ncbi:hypothetical protein GCM10011365_02600 [Marinicella pacifica]|uniref:Bacterial repeat domain-containing protein n=2 Tax=Marinicella pacifica TaxID=1171543 RepID=A0A917FIZ5_9GAMM|nr:hypothetical protein GCM10011365_02600 [Marinicella pacifica]
MALMVSLSAQGQALHWLAQPDADIGPVINHYSSSPKISTNGRYVSFSSYATNLIPDDTNNERDIFLKDLVTGEIKLVTSTQSGAQINFIGSAFSAPTSDGRFIVFASGSAALPNGSGLWNDEYLYLKDMVTGQVTNLSVYGAGDYFEATGGVHLTDDARYITFGTYDDIDPNFSASRAQVYRKDLLTDTYELISVSEDGLSAADDTSSLASVSPNGRYILMSSEAHNLTADVINNSRDNLFLRDMNTGTTQLVNVTPSGDSSAFDDFSPSGSVSNIGTVAFKTSQSDIVVNDTNGLSDLFYYDGTNIQRINLTPAGNEVSDASPVPVISGDGSRIVFSSYSSELVNNDNNETGDLFSYDTASGQLTVVTVNNSNETANASSTQPSLSLDGSRLAFVSTASDLSNEPVSILHPEVFAYRFAQQQFKKLTEPAFNPHTIIEAVYGGYLSSDQQTVLYHTKSYNLTADSVEPNTSHLYRLDRSDNSHHLVALKSSASDISANGRYVVVNSDYFQPGGLIDLGSNHIFLYDRLNDVFTQIDEGYSGRVNNDGVVVFYTSKDIAANDSNGEYDVYLYDPVSQVISLISEGLDGMAAGGEFPDIGGQGNNTWVVFESEADNLVPADTNNRPDIFMKKVPSGTITRVSQTPAGVEANERSDYPRISEDASTIVFSTQADNLTSDDYSQAGTGQILYYDRVNTLLHLASKNESGLPLYGQNYSMLPSVSESGRYISYVYEDETYVGVDFAGDDDFREDAVLFDIVTQTPKIISVTPQGDHTDDSVNNLVTVVEDEALNPPLIGVTFSAYGPNFSGVDNHPGHLDMYLYQQGGPDLDLHIQVVGAGTVSGTSGINCSSDCHYDFSLGTELTLVANASTGATFTGWQMDFGHCQDDTNPCQVTMDRAKTLTAYFVDPNDIIFIDGFDN